MYLKNSGEGINRQLSEEFKTQGRGQTCTGGENRRKIEGRTGGNRKKLHHDAH